MQHRHSAAVLLAALVLAAPQPARADIRLMYEAGAWSLYTGTSTGGRAVCDMRVTDDANAKKIDVIYFINDDHLTVRMNKTTWQIPANTRIGVVLQFDAYPIWTATADGAGGDVEFTVPTNALAEFSRQFRYANRMRINFPEGSEAPWLASLAGTNFMLDRFLECLQRIRGNGTQPYAGPPAAPVPTQPYAGRNPQPPANEDTPSFGGQRQPYRGTQGTPSPAAPTPAPPPESPPAAANDDRI